MGADLRGMLADAEADPERFWGQAAERVHWLQPYDRVLDWTPPTFRWFAGGQTNLGYNCVDLQVERGLGDKAALIGENEWGGESRLTYKELLGSVRQVAAALRGIGVQRGDRVAIYMPTMPEAIVAMLACARIGAPHMVVFAGFGSGALGERMRLAGARVLLAADATWRKGKQVRLWDIAREAMANSPVEKAVVLVRTQEAPLLQAGRDLTWDQFLAGGTDGGFESMEANEPAFVLATSGTTAKPKLPVHTHGGYQVGIRNTAEWMFGLQAGDVWWSTSDIGWIVGHSFIVYAPLLVGATTIAYEGALDHPGPDTFYRIVAKHGVSGVFTAPTAVRMLMRYGTEPARAHDLGSVTRVFSAGEVLNPPAWEWFQKEVFGDRIPVLDHWWQTETGGPVVGNPWGLGHLPIRPGSAGIPLPGMRVEVRTPEGEPLAAGEKGILVVTRPFPGLTQTLWGDPERYARDYWQRIPGAYFTGDAASIDEQGYVWFSGRADEIIKIAGHRIGTIEVETAFLRHPAVVEAGAVGRPDELRGEVISAFAVVRPGTAVTDELRRELLATVRHELGPVAVIGEINFVPALPKTRSGKIMRRVFKAIIAARDPGDISTIEDEGSVDEVREAWAKMRAALGEEAGPA